MNTENKHEENHRTDGPSDAGDDSRRGFIRGSSLLLAGAMPGGFHLANASDKAPSLKVGIIGCGRQGMRLAGRLLESQPTTTITALADVFGDRVQRAARTLKGRYGSQVKFDNSTRFTGIDSYQQLLDSRVDVAILSTCPAFRPIHFQAAVEAKTNILAARPAATDVIGVKRFMESNDLANASGLAVRIPLEHRSNSQIRDTVQQLHQGIVGDIVLMRAYSHSPPLRQGNSCRTSSEMEYQLRNWQNYQWTSGGGMLEQHVDRLDLCNWVMRGTLPCEAQGVSATSIDSTENAQQLPHLSVEYRYQSGARLFSVWRRSDSPWSGPAVSVHGTAGWCDLQAGKIYDLQGNLTWKASSKSSGIEPTDWLYASSLANDGHGAAQSTLLAIHGREASRAAKQLSLADCLDSNQEFALPASKTTCD